MTSRRVYLGAVLLAVVTAAAYFAMLPQLRHLTPEPRFPTVAAEQNVDTVINVDRAKTTSEVVVKSQPRHDDSGDDAQAGHEEGRQAEGQAEGQGQEDAEGGSGSPAGSG